MLSAAEYDRLYLNLVAYIQKPGSLGTVYLVAADRYKIDLHPFRIYPDLSKRLYGIRMKNHAGITTLGRLRKHFDIIHRSDLVVHMHDRNKYRIISHGFLKRFGSYSSALIHIKIRNGKSLLFEILHRLRYCGMLYLRSDDMLSRPPVRKGTPYKRQVVGLRSA